MNEIEGAEEAFNLEPFQMQKKPEQFSFGKIDQKKAGQSHSQLIEQDQQESNTSANGKVTIPIDWDYIIDKYVKNTNTNLFDASKGSSNKEDGGDSDDDF